MNTKRGVGFYIKLILAVVLLVGVGTIISVFVPKNIDVSWTDNDYKSAIEKINLLSIANSDIMPRNNTVPAELTLTSGELSALLTKTDVFSVATSGFIKNVEYANVKLLDNNELELVLKLKEIDNDLEILSKNSKVTAQADYNKYKEYTKYFMTAAKTIPVYSKMKIDKKEDSTLKIELMEIKLGQVTVPNDMINAAQNTVDKITRNSGTVIEKLEINNDNIYFKGTLPGSILSKIK